MNKLKVTVSGWKNETFVGNDKEVETFLLNLKKSQDDLYDMKSYRKIMPTFKPSFLHSNGKMNSEYSQYADKYFRNVPTNLVEFRKKSKQTGLKIKIEKYKNPFF